MCKYLISIFRVITPTVLAAASAAVCGNTFDASQLSGEWSEVVAPKYACGSDSARVRFALSKDRKKLLFQLDRKIRLTSGKESDQYDAEILHEEDNALFIRYPDPDLKREMAEWEMRFIGPGAYRWRSLSWKEGVFNGLIGVRCPGMLGAN
jgi:hypothetical protein